MFILTVQLTNEQVHRAADGLRAIHRQIAGEFGGPELTPEREELLTQTYAATSAILAPLQEHLTTLRRLDVEEGARRRPAYRVRAKP